MYAAQQVVQHCIQYNEDFLFAFLVCDVNVFDHAAVLRLSFLLIREWFCTALAPLIPEEPRASVEYCRYSRVIFCLDRQVHDAFALGWLVAVFTWLFNNLKRGCRKGDQRRDVSFECSLAVHLGFNAIGGEGR